MNKLAASSTNTVPYGTNVPGKLGKNAPNRLPPSTITKDIWMQNLESDICFR